jgi:hypothetical protein
MALLAILKRRWRFIFPTPDVNPDMHTSPDNPISAAFSLDHPNEKDRDIGDLDCELHG